MVMVYYGTMCRSDSNSLLQIRTDVKHDYSWNGHSVWKFPNVIATNTIFTSNDIRRLLAASWPCHTGRCGPTLTGGQYYDCIDRRRCHTLSHNLDSNPIQNTCRQTLDMNARMTGVIKHGACNHLTAIIRGTRDGGTCWWVSSPLQRRAMLHGSSRVLCLLYLLNLVNSWL
jgi:hypothetical protein